VNAAEADSRIYELRTYWTHPGQLDALLTRFREHTLKLFERHGMENIAYWVPADEKDGAGGKLVYLLAHMSREAAGASWKAFVDDPKWKTVAAASEADGKIVSKLESVYLTATSYSPVAKDSLASPERIFELRTYTTPEGKLAALDARFGGGETDLFEKHGMRGFGYFHPMDADDGAERTLVYVLAHASREAAAASWKGFREDPEWIAMKAETEKDGRLAEKVESMFLVPVDFSPTK
jgi:hypothetical protein